MRPEVNVSVGAWLVDFLWKAGYEVIRLTHDQVLRAPGQVAATIEKVLGRPQA